MFNAVPSNPKLVELEKGLLARWEREGTFRKLCEKNRGNERFSFIDGPMTANNPMGVHHGWGRTYKDIVQRFKAMDGFDGRYQNGFDCQGLWVEVEVEKELCFNSKRDILEYGLGNFAERCRERVVKYAAVQIEQSKRLGQWMDWENSYYTMSNSNIEHIWHFLKVCSERGWLYSDQRIMPWCVRCGTSLSQHELSDSYKDLVHRAVFVLFPLKDRNESLLVWTTTPWTLPANTGVAVNPEVSYILLETEYGRVWVAERRSAILDRAPSGIGFSPIERVQGSWFEGLEYEAPFEELPAAQGICRRVVLWNEVSADEGSGIVHIAPGCGAEDYVLGKEQGLAVLAPVDDCGRFIEGYDYLTGKDTVNASKIVIRVLKEELRLYREESHRHRYPVCWRCGEELIFRLEAEWFISAREVRDPMRKAASQVTWIPDHSGKRMEDWLNNMGDWCISRKRFWGLPLPFYTCGTCGNLAVIGSVSELRERALNPSMVSGELDLHRPWIDDISIKCPKCGGTAVRIPEVGDCWLDAGITPFSTLDYLEDHGVDSKWAKWFPAVFVCEMREQIRLWFYAQLFMSVTLNGTAPYKTVMTYEKVHDEKGRPMHKSSGNAIWFDDAVERMGADVMRWLYASRNNTQNLNFGYSLADDVRRRLLTLWNVYSFFVTYARLDGWKPSPMRDLDTPPASSSLLDRWIGARTRQLGTNVRASLEEYDMASVLRDLDSFIDDLSNWYIRRNRRRFWKAENDSDKDSGYAVLHWVLLTFCRLAAPVIPFMTDNIYRNIVDVSDMPESVHLTRYPRLTMSEGDEDVLVSMALVRDITNQGLSARNVAKLRVRQPLRKASVSLPDSLSLPDGSEEIILEELNVKELSIENRQDTKVTVTLDTELDDSLIWEGYVRDLIRQVQNSRKSLGLPVDRTITLEFVGSSGVIGSLEASLDYIKGEVLASAVLLTAIGSETTDIGCDTGWEPVKCGGDRLCYRISI